MVDSRLVEEGSAVRRRRECRACGRRYTTFERVEDVKTAVLEVNGDISVVPASENQQQPRPRPRPRRRHRYLRNT